MEDRDFIDFKFGDHWASDFNLLAVSSGDRYSPPVYGSVNPNTATIAGKVGVYKWKTQVNEKVFNIKIAFDNINGQILNQIKEWLNPFKIDKLVFKEEPYKYYWVALNTEPKLDFLPFLEETKVVNGIAFKEGVYKGEFELQFVCFDNYGYSDWQSFDENYDYVVKEIEGEESISFNDGSDNNLIITKIEGNSKQETRSGKNKFDISKAIRASGSCSFKNNGDSIDITANEIGIYISANIDITDLFKEGETIYAKANFVASSSNTGAYRIQWGTDSGLAKGDVVLVSSTSDSVKSGIVPTKPEGATKLLLYLYGNVEGTVAIGDTVTYSKIMLSNQPITDYEEYGAMPSPEFPSSIRNCGDNVNIFDMDTAISKQYNPNGVLQSTNRYIKEGNKTKMTYSVYQYGRYFFDKQKLQKGTYTYSFDVYLSNDATNLEGVYSIRNFTNSTDIKPVTIITLSNNKKKFSISFEIKEEAEVSISLQPENNNSKILYIENLKLEQGLIATPYSPYNCGNVNIKVCNKNFFDINSVSEDVNGTLDKYETGIGATWRNLRYTNVLKIRTIKAGTYKICGKQTVSNTNSGDIFRFFYEDGTSVEMGIYNNYIPTTVIFTKDVVAMQLFINSNKSTGDYFRIDDFMLVSTDTTDVSYVEHQEQSFTFPLAEGQRLMKGDYLADDGIHHKRKTIVLDGTENWISWNTKNNTIGFILQNSSIKNISNKSSTIVKCNCLQSFSVLYLNENDIEGIAQWDSSHRIRVRVSLTKVTTLDEWKTYLASQYTNGTPVIVEYELAEEEIEPYTEEQQIVYDEIKNNLYSYEGTNHIFSTDEVSPLLSISYVPKQDIYIDYVANQSNLLNDSAFYYNNDIYKKSYFDAETGDATKSGISEDRPVYLYNAGTTTANLNLTFDMIIPAEGSPLVINTESCKLTDNGTQVLKQVSSISISDFSKYKPFLEIYDGTPSNWQIQIDSNLCEIYLKHKTDKTKIISLNKFNDNQSFLSLANCNFVDYSKPFPTLITAISGTALENTVFNKLSVGTSAQNYRLKNVDVKWKHTYL